MMSQGYAWPEARQAYARARALGAQLGETQQAVFVFMGLWAGCFTAGETRAAQELADQLLEVAVRDGTPTSLVWAHSTLVTTQFVRGELEAARDHCTRAMARYREEDYLWSEVDPGMNTLAFASMAACELGLADEARTRVREAFALAQRLNRPYLLALAEAAALAVYPVLGDAQRAGAHAARLLQLATEQHLAVFVAIAKMSAGRVLALEGRPDDGIATLREGLAEYFASGQRTGLGRPLGWLAEAQLAAGAVADARATVEDALAAVRDEAIWVPELLRLRGKIAAAAGAATATVEASYQEAIALAHSFGAKMVELRATTSLGRWLQSCDRAAEAHALLAPLYATFTEGFDTLDLQEAKALLDELG
jgi:tetratricopeptide (TPR) repeat protein